MKRELQIAAWLLFIGLIVVLIYTPGLRGPFVFDDASSIINNQKIRVADLSVNSLRDAAFSGESGILKRPIAYVSFAINYRMADGLENTLPFKATNLLIHLINTGLIYWLMQLLLSTNQKRKNSLKKSTNWVPIATAGLWAVHPINVTSVLYVVQRMTSLSALFVLLGLILFLHGRRLMGENRRQAFALMIAGVVVGMTLGLGSKENAVLLLLFIALIEFIFFERSLHSLNERHSLFLFYLLAVALPLTTLLIAIALNPEWLLSGYAVRDYTLGQRVLTETRVLWSYAGLILAPSASGLTLFHDDIAVSTGLFSPWTTVISVIAWMLTVYAAFRWRKTLPIFSFAILWFLVGHSLESSIIGLEIAHEHRNYLPSLGLLAGLSYGLSSVFEKAQRAIVGAALLLVVGICFSFVTFSRATAWANEDTLIAAMAHNHPRSARSQAMLAELHAVKHGDWNQAIAYYHKAWNLAPGEPAYLIRMVQFGHASISPSEMTLLSEKIKESLAAPRPPTAYTISIINDLSQCATTRQGPCRAIYKNVLEWLRVLSDNPRTPETVRQNAIIGWYNIGTAQGDYAAALNAAEHGRRAYQDDPIYTLMAAEVRIHQHQLALAEALISSVLNSPRPPHEHAKQVAEHLQLVVRQRQKKQTTP